MKSKAILVRQEGVIFIGSEEFTPYLLIPFVGGKWAGNATTCPLTIEDAYKFADKRGYEVFECVSDVFPKHWEQNDAQSFFDKSVN